jgi:thioredoxin-dependent peroxiredoxin
MALQLGDTAPDSEADTSEGTIDSHDWTGDSRAVLVSHPSTRLTALSTTLKESSWR